MILTVFRCPLGRTQWKNPPSSGRAAATINYKKNISHISKLPKIITIKIQGSYEFGNGS